MTNSLAFAAFTSNERGRFFRFCEISLPLLDDQPPAAAGFLQRRVRPRRLSADVTTFERSRFFHSCFGYIFSVEVSLRGIPLSTD